MVKLVFEIWSSEGNDARTVSLCLAGPDGDSSRRLLEPNARLICTFAAGSYFEAMTIHNRLMGWGEYRPDSSWGAEPYEPFTAEQLERQRAVREPRSDP